MNYKLTKRKNVSDDSSINGGDASKKNTQKRNVAYRNGFFLVCSTPIKWCSNIIWFFKWNWIRNWEKYDEVKNKMENIE